MGSVKDPIMDDSPAGKLYIPAKPHKLGRIAWKVSGRFSVGDLKEAIPPVEIDGKGQVLAMLAGAYFEHAADNGISSSYLGLFSPQGEVVSAQDLIAAGDVSDIIVMRLGKVPTAKTADAIKEYHSAIQAGDLTVYVADAESIFRRGFPLGSSIFEKIFKYTGRAEQYETLATYEETVRELDEIRAQVAKQGLEAFPELRSHLANSGLGEIIPNPGYRTKQTRLNFTTKFALEGDVDITDQEAKHRMGLSESEYAAWKVLAGRCADDQIGWCEAKQILNFDGKIEALVVDGIAQLTDFACTPDENRLMIRYRRNETGFLLPTNKELQRAMFRQAGVYRAKAQAKERAQQRDETRDTWQNYLFDFIKRDKLNEVAQQSCSALEAALKEVANRILEKKVFDARPIEEWVTPLLPFASRVQGEQQ